MVHLKRRDEGILKKYLTLFVALLFVLALTSIGFAAGKISIKPIISIGARYDSNYHKTERHKRAVMTYMAKPGIQFGYESAKFAVLFNYTLEGYLYDDVGHGHRGYQETSDLAYLGHLGSLDVRYSPTDRLTFVLEDGFYLSRYPTSYDRLSDTIERRKYWVNRLTPGVIFDFEHRVTAALRYRWTRKHFLETGETGDESDSVEHRAMANFIYRPTRTMTFDLNYNIYWMNYDDYERGDYTSSEIRLDLQKRFRSFAFDAGVGWHHRSYHDYDDDQSGRDALTYKVSALWQDPPPPPEAMRRPGKRFMRPRSEVYMAAESNFNHYGANFRGYRFTLDAGHVFFNRIHARAQGWYQISDYHDYEWFTSSGRVNDRLDRTYDVSGSLAYLFTDRLALAFTAGRQERMSNLDGFDYENNYMILNLDLNYDISGRGGYTEEVLYY